MRFSHRTFIITTLALLALMCGCISLSANTPLSKSAATNFATGKPSEYFTVYCVNNKLEVGSRSLSDMQDARGMNVCRHPDKEEFYPTIMQAQEAAAELGGVGMPCKCER